MTPLTFITSNKGKLTEAKTRLEPLGYQVIQNDLGYPEIQADTLQEVASYGVDCVRQRLKTAFFLEDSGIFISALKEFPGVYSKYVYQTIGLTGILTLLDKVTDRSAVFRSVIAYAQPGQAPALFVGECPGTLTHEPRGTGGFGYDPLFIPQGWTKTFAEVSPQEKNTVSHRGKAMDLFLHYLSP
jgi:XTP/dITP diphosphohydrolase